MHRLDLFGSGLLPGAQYRLAVSLYNEERLILHETRAVAAPMGQQHAAVELHLPVGGAGLQLVHVEADLVDTYPGLAEEERLIARLSMPHLLQFEEQAEQRVEAAEVEEATVDAASGTSRMYEYAVASHAAKTARELSLMSPAGKVGERTSSSCFDSSYLFQDCHPFHSADAKRCGKGSNETLLVDHVAYCLLPKITLKAPPSPFTDMLGSRYTTSFYAFSWVTGMLWNDCMLRENANGDAVAVASRTRMQRAKDDVICGRV